ncbi:MAG: hypothetical protein ICV70_08000 [Jiangellaceae bacterium]|nr:hypothetical protein [Jiangellaceae bacterium]
MNTDAFLDGNAAAGMLGELFAVEVTAAGAQCAHCGRVSVVAQARLYVDSPGVVGRCPSCEEVLFRMVRAPGRAWLDLRGVNYLEFALPEDG